MPTPFTDPMDELRGALAEIDRSNDPSWLTDLEPRKVEESEFHDDKVNRHGLSRASDELPELHRGNKKFYSTVAKSKQFLSSWIESHVPGKVFLDYACGQGASTRLAARAGARLAVGLDISCGSIVNARADAAEEGLADNTYFVQADCENTRLPDACVDVMLCSGMLHHLNVELAFPEMYRVLKPGGVCLAIEALDYNPIVKLYRLLTPALRTEWEKHHILSHQDLKLASRLFSVKNVRYWHLLSVMTTPLRHTPLFQPALGLANAIDSLVLQIPPLSYLAWQFSFELHRPGVEGIEPGNSLRANRNPTRRGHAA